MVRRKKYPGKKPFKAKKTKNFMAGERTSLRTVGTLCLGAVPYLLMSGKIVEGLVCLVVGVVSYYIKDKAEEK